MQIIIEIPENIKNNLLEAFKNHYNIDNITKEKVCNKLKEYIKNIYEEYKIYMTATARIQLSDKARNEADNETDTIGIS